MYWKDGLKILKAYYYIAKFKLFTSFLKYKQNNKAWKSTKFGKERLGLPHTMLNSHWKDMELEKKEEKQENHTRKLIKKSLKMKDAYWF